MFFLLGLVVGVVTGVFLSPETRAKIQNFFKNLGK